MLKPLMIGILSSFVVIAACSTTSPDIPEEEASYFNLLTGEPCEPNADNAAPENGGEAEEPNQAGDMEQNRVRQGRGQGNGEQCGPHYFHAEDFPQPGCDGEGCCRMRAEDVAQVRNQERIQCRCRARFGGDHDTSSLPECCADRPERQCGEGESGEGESGEGESGEGQSGEAGEGESGEGHQGGGSGEDQGGDEEPTEDPVDEEPIEEDGPIEG